MSRGYGKIERKALAVLQYHRLHAPTARAAAQGLDTIGIAERVYLKAPAKLFRLTSKSEETSVRRALAKLARDGLVRDLGTLRGPRKHWRAAPSRKRS